MKDARFHQQVLNNEPPIQEAQMSTIQSVTAEQLELWKALQEFDFDEPGATNPFSLRLGKEQGWSAEYVERVVEEYRRFLFLTMVAGHVVCPSEDVDRAWHEHLLHSRSYWDRLCGTVLKRNLHHDPSRGGPGELRKHWTMYRETLKSYRRIFGAAPPQEVWPAIHARFDAKSAKAPINRRDYWIVRKPQFKWLKKIRKSGLMAVIGLPLLAAGLGPLDLNGPDFLQLYLWLLFLAIAIVVILQIAVRFSSVENEEEELTPGELACLSFGPSAIVCTEVAGLVQNRTIDISQKDSGSWNRKSESELIASRDLLPDASKFHKLLYQEIRSSRHSLQSLTSAMEPVTREVEESLARRGYLVGRTKGNLIRILSVLIFGGLLAFGGMKIAIGVQRNKPVEILVFLSAFTAFGAVVSIFNRPYRSHAGRSLLSTQRSAHEDLKPQVQDYQTDANVVMMCAALYGTSVLGGAHLDSFKQSWIAEGLQGNTVPSTTSGGGSGCSTSSCGGSSCGGGGGCGGGGCGGCGGS